MEDMKGEAGGNPEQESLYELHGHGLSAKAKATVEVMKDGTVYERGFEQARGRKRNRVDLKQDVASTISYNNKSVADQVMVDLKVGKRWLNVECRHCSELDAHYLVGIRKKDGAPYEAEAKVIFPVSSLQVLTMPRLLGIFDYIPHPQHANARLHMIYLAIMDGDSTVSYYILHDTLRIPVKDTRQWQKKKYLADIKQKDDMLKAFGVEGVLRDSIECTEDEDEDEDC